MKTKVEHIQQKADDALIGLENALEVYAMVVRAEKALASMKEVLLEGARDEFDKHGEKELAAYGFKISQSASGRYNYSGYEAWNELQAQRKEIEKKMMLGYKMEQEYVDSDTGETYPKAEYKPNKVSLSFKKVI